MNSPSSQPYITKAYFSLQNPPTKLVKIAIGDGAIGAGAEFVDAPTVQIIETFPQIIGYDPEVFDYFATQYAVRSVAVEMSADAGAGRTCVGTTSISLTRKQEGSSRHSTARRTTFSVARRLHAPRSVHASPRSTASMPLRSARCRLLSAWSDASSGGAASPGVRMAHSTLTMAAAFLARCGITRSTTHTRGVRIHAACVQNVLTHRRRHGLSGRHY
jgi:hypothetical protein